MVTKGYTPEQIIKNLLSEEDNTDSSLRSECHEHNTFRTKPKFTERGTP